MATSKDRLDSVIEIVTACGFVCNRETVGVVIKKLTQYRAAAEQGIGSVGVCLQDADIAGAEREMRLLLSSLDTIES